MLLFFFVEYEHFVVRTGFMKGAKSYLLSVINERNVF